MSLSDSKAPLEGSVPARFCRRKAFRPSCLMPARDTTASARPACKRRWTSIGDRRVGWDTSSAVILELRKGVAIGLGEVCRMTSLDRSEEHTSELQSLMRISYAVFCLKKKTQTDHHVDIVHHPT